MISKKIRIFIMMILLAFFLTSTGKLHGQNSSVGVVFAPTDRGLGFRYDRQLSSTGFYGSASWGNYRFLNGAILKDHVRMAAGVAKYVKNKKLNINHLFSLGISLHSYGAMKSENFQVEQKALRRVSAEAGVGFIYNHFNIGWCYDPLKKEVVVNCGYYFN
jgi:hypothetical protein